MQARYYDPVIGRFYSNDPMGALEHLQKGNVHGFGRYTYGNNNPYKYVDPDGLEAMNAFSNLADLFKGSQSQTKNIASGLKQTATQTASGLKDGAQFTKEFAKANLGNASTLAGVIPGGQGVSIALAGADLLVNGSGASLASASNGAIVEKTATDLKTDFGKVKPTNTTKAIIAGASQIIGTISGDVQSEVEKQSRKENEDEN